MKGYLKLFVGLFLVKKGYDLYKERETNLPKRRIFISHSWKESSDDYALLKEKINNQEIKIYDHSIPVNKAFNEKRVKELEKIFRKQMVYCSKIFVLAHSKIKKESFVMTEIKIAKEMKKEIIAIKPYGQRGIPQFIRRKADKVIANNIESIKKVLK